MQHITIQLQVIYKRRKEKEQYTYQEKEHNIQKIQNKTKLPHPHLVH